MANVMLTPFAANELAKSPVFVWHPDYNRELTDDETEWIREHIMSGDRRHVPTQFPYKTFGLVFKDSEGKHETVLWIWAHPHVIELDNLPDGMTDYHTILTVYRRDKFEGETCYQMLKYAADSSKGCMVDFWMGKRRCPERALHRLAESHKDYLSRSVVMTRNTVARFAFEIMSKAATVLRVQPDTSHTPRSVEWVQARTHYLLVHRHQAIRCRDQQRGPSSHELTRAAHWRRAHLRRLSSDKFKQKKGQLVPVKQAWVGPIEWKGNDGKIYKVME